MIVSQTVYEIDRLTDERTVFHKPRDQILGLMSAAYSLGCILSLPFIPFIVDRFGRRLAIVIGSFIMLIGVALQTAAVNCE